MLSDKFSLYKRGSVWYVRIWDETTRTYTTAKSTGKTNRDEAAIKAAEMINHGQIKTREKDPLFVDELLKYWNNKKDLSIKYKQSSIRYIEKHIATYPAFKKMRLSQIKAGKINLFADDLEHEGYSGRVTNRILQLLKTYFNYCYTREIINFNIADKILRKKEKLKRRGELTPPEILKIASLTWPDHRLKVAVLLGCFAGMRKGEIRALRWCDIDFDTNFIYIRHNFTGEYDSNGAPVFKEPKADSKREWPYMVFPELRKAILQQWQETPFKRPNDLILPNVWSSNRKNHHQATTHTPLPETAIKRGFKKMLEAIGVNQEKQKLRNLSFHSTRHSFTSFIDQVGSSKTAMSLTGHSTREMLENYSHANKTATIEHLETANSALNRYRKEA